ncbi:MAG: hypothetical protein EBX36_02310 [Planctomycetia bacterium]|nr:hypothetical protein [Planctomycetia bacterium]
MTTLLSPPGPAVALVPLGCYLAGLACVHLRRRPLAVSGMLDAVLLAAGISGLAVAGPLALLVPGTSPWTWPVLAFLCGLGVAVAVLVSRPRLVVYNITVEQFRPVVAEVVASLDPGARWAGESAALPGRGFQLHIEGNGPLRTVSVVNVGERSSAEGWGEFTRRLRRALRGLRVRRSPWGVLFAGLGGGLLAAAAWVAVWPPAAAPAATTPVPAVPPASPPTSRPQPLSGAPHASARRSHGA